MCSPQSVPSFVTSSRSTWSNWWWSTKSSTWAILQNWNKSTWNSKTLIKSTLKNYRKLSMKWRLMNKVRPICLTFYQSRQISETSWWRPVQRKRSRSSKHLLTEVHPTTSSIIFNTLRRLHIPPTSEQACTVASSGIGWPQPPSIHHFNHTSLIIIQVVARQWMPWTQPLSMISTWT